MKNINKVINILIFLSIVILITFFLKSDIYEFDDYIQSFFYTTNIKSLFTQTDQGRYISWFFMKIVCHWTSLILNINPNENIIPKIVVGADFAILSYLYAKLGAITAKAKEANPLLYLSAFFICMSLVVLHFDYLNRWNQHFDYILMFVVFLWFLCVVGKYFFNDELPPRKDYLRNCLLFFIMGVSAYFNIFIAFFILVFLGIYYKNNYRVKDLLTARKYTSIRMPVLLGLLGSILVFINQNLQAVSIRRMPEQNLAANFVDFTQAWLHSMFLNPAILVINLTIIFLMAVVFLKNKKITKSIMLSSVVILAGLIFEYLLFFCGKSYVNRYFWVSFSRVYLIHYFYCLVPIFLLLGEVIKSKRITYSLVPFFISLAIFFTTIPFYKQKFEISKFERREMYMIVKSEMFSISNAYANAPAPKEHLDWDVYTYEQGRINWCMLWFYLNYKLVYKHKALPLEFMSTQEFLEKSKARGLTFTEEELGRADFNNFSIWKR